MELNNLKHFAYAGCLLFAMAACNDNAGTARTDKDDTTALGDSRRDAGDRSLLTNREENFVTDVIDINTEEIAALREGINMGTDAELKSHARQMMADHEKMDKDLRAYASKKNVELDEIDTSGMARLKARKGIEWDREWADEVGDMHKRLVKKFERAQNRTQDAELKAMIDRTLPTLRSHLDMAEKLETKLEGKSDNRSSREGYK